MAGRYDALPSLRLLNARRSALRRATAVRSDSSQLPGACSFRGPTLADALPLSPRARVCASRHSTDFPPQVRIGPQNGLNNSEGPMGRTSLTEPPAAHAISAERDEVKPRWVVQESVLFAELYHEEHSILQPLIAHRGWKCAVVPFEYVADDAAISSIWQNNYTRLTALFGAHP
eukprot:1227120-Pleurochrysis_carterae.AAC.1